MEGDSDISSDCFGARTSAIPTTSDKNSIVELLHNQVLDDVSGNDSGNGGGGGITNSFTVGGGGGGQSLMETILAQKMAQERIMINSAAANASDCSMVGW
jgi:hypothetical protein